jgi:hypothetical protein
MAEIDLSDLMTIGSSRHACIQYYSICPLQEIPPRQQWAGQLSGMVLSRAMTDFSSFKGFWKE